MNRIDPHPPEVLEILRRRGPATRIAVVGASNDPSKSGNVVVRNLAAKGYTVLPVNPREAEIAGLPAYPDLAAVPGPIHLVSVVTPPGVTRSVLEEAARLDLPAVWLQDGSYDDAALAVAAKAPYRTVYEACIMVASNFGLGAGSLEKAANGRGRLVATKQVLKQGAPDGTASAWKAEGPIGPPTLPVLFASFLRLGCASFGGPGTVAYIRRLAVVQRRWINEDDFRLGTALCQAVPGATSMQAAAYVGLRTRGLGGAVAAYVGFGLPAFALMFAMSLAYERAVALHAVTAALTGLRALVVALVVNAAWAFGRSAIHTGRSAVFAASTAVLFLAGGSPFLIVVVAGLAGAVLLEDRQGDGGGAGRPPIQWSRALRSPLVVAAVGVVFIGTLWVFDRRLAILGVVMMKVDAFAFGGGFASVPLMYHEVVEARGWLPPPVFLDGMALGQVTPGPVVITATFVGQRVAGLAGALVATVSIFLPSLFVLLVAEPFFEGLRSRPSFAGAEHGLVLSFVGLLASVAVHFARITPWSMTSGAIAALGLAALLLEVDVVWVVLAGGVVSALLM